jgi:MarR family transcriptional regulator, organic hydroperoxide resistance regulator
MRWLDTRVALKTQFKSAEDSPGFMLWKASNRLQRMHARCLTDLAITPSQFSLMTCLVYLQQTGVVTSARIVAHTGMDKMLVSDLVRALEKKRLVRRQAHPEDGRSWLIEPTARGIELTNSAVREVETLDTAFFANVRNVRRFHADLVALVNSED